MPATDEPFGSQVYQELRRQSGFDVMTQVWDYAAIQKLKQADREQVLKLLANFGCPLVSDSPLDASVVAQLLANEVRRRREQLQTAGMTVLGVDGLLQLLGQLLVSC